MTAPLHIEIPRPTGLVRHALPRVAEGTLIPLAIFLVTLRLLGVRGAIVAGLVWSAVAIGSRLVLRRRVPGLLVVGTITLCARTVVTIATGSTFVYFLQPSLATAAVAFAFLISAALGRPLAQVLARDFFPFPPEVVHNPHVRRVFARITVLWGVTQVTNAAITLWLLVSQSTATFLLARTAMSFTLTPLAIAGSAALFFRSMRRHGIAVRFTPARASR